MSVCELLVSVQVSSPQFEEDVDRKRTLCALWHNLFPQPRREDIRKKFPSSPESSFPFAYSPCLFLFLQTECQSLICKFDIFSTSWWILGMIRSVFFFGHLTNLYCTLFSSVVSRCHSNNTTVMFKTVNLNYLHLSQDVNKRWRESNITLPPVLK